MVASFGQIAGWMRFSSLDRRWSGDFGVHTLAWRITDVASEPWTARIDSFKYVMNRTGSARKKVLKGAAQTLEVALPSLIRAYHLDPKEVGLMTALSSSDTQCDPRKPLPAIGKWLAGKVGAQWCGDALTKQAHKSLHSIGNGPDRDAEVQNKYVCAKLNGVKTIVILDDIVTRGSTFSEIERAVTAANPGVKTLPIALGKSERQAWATQCGRPIDNAHVPAKWAATWDSA